MMILREAVCRASASDSAFLAAVVAKWQGSASREIHRVLVEALQAALPASAELALQYLLRGAPVLGGVVNRDGVFQGDDSVYTRRLIAALAPHLDQKGCQLLEQYIVRLDLHQTVGATAEAKQRLYRLNRKCRYDLLAALGVDRVTSLTRSQMIEDARRFGVSSVSAPTDLEVCLTESPMSAEEMLAASDDEVLGLFNDLPDATGGWHPRRNFEGGSEQASEVFAEAAKREPARFARLLSRFEPGTYENPVCRALPSIASQLPLEQVEALIQQLISCGFSSLAFRTAAASASSKALQQQPSDARLSAALLGILEGWLSQVPQDAMTLEGEPDPEELDAASCAPLLFSAGGYAPLPDGNWTILDALTTAYLRGNPPQLEAWMQVLENHLERQDAPEVWRAMGWKLEHVLRAAPARAERFFSNLFARYPSVIHSSFGLRLLAQAMHTLPLTAVQRWMEDLGAGSWVRREQAFGELLALLATRHDATPWALESVERALAQWQAVSGSSAAEDRLILGLTIGVAELWDEPTRRERASELLLRLVPRASGAVAEAAMRAFSSTAPLLWDAATRQLLCALAGAPAVMLRGWYENLVGQLDQHLPADAALIKDVVTALVAELTRTSQYVLPDVGAALSRIALSLQRQPPPLREAGLELFEQLLDLGVSEARDLLKELDRLKSA
ncbi:MAG: hypothetical protein IPI49_30915 [Myxococcales bacterium]|nr:hypothetical protein [Myxococcales bacterium]